MSAKSIYIHLPFCKTKCPYCDFASFAEPDQVRHQQYIDAICNEINLRLAQYQPESNLIETIFFGGGTPSVHSQEQLKQILDTLREYFVFVDDIEITLEANPGTIDRARLQEFSTIGINRISIGAQTFDEALLVKLGRGHTVQDTFTVINDIKAVDFKSWSFDLIYGLPGQSLQSWQDTLQMAVDFAPPHISAYALSIEERTPYGAIYKNSYHPDLPQEDLVVEMYNAANEIFAQSGLERYEISNWSRINHEARHNLTYWYANEYYAFGLSAHGYIETKRYKNTRDLKNYLKTFADQASLSADKGFNFVGVEDLVKIEKTEQIEEKILLNLRLRSGLEISPLIEAAINQKALNKYVKSGYLRLESGVLSLTNMAQMISNRIIGDLLS